MTNAPDAKPAAPRPQPSDSQASPPKSKLPAAFPPSRIALIVFVIIALGVIAYELNARSGFNRTFDALNDAFTRAEEDSDSGLAEGIYKADLDKLVAGNPSRQVNEEEDSELFTWAGLLQRYRMRVFYTDGDMIVRYEQE